MIDKDPAHLHPDLQPLCAQWEEKCKAQGLDVKLTETFRDPAREDELHAEGITRATGATCDHCFEIDGQPASKAFDFACYDSDGNYIKDGTNEAYAQAGAIGKDLGMVWGGDWLHPDWDHLQID